MASKDPLDILTTYVRGVKTADTKLLRSLFADDMELVSMNVGCMKGGARIAKYYGQLLAERGGADPTPGPFIRTGNMIAFEIDVRHGDEMHKVSDFFTFKNGKVQRLAVYQGPIRKVGEPLRDFTRKKPRKRTKRR
ncbi:MAG: nuclear transport factor 2 family protein [Alphaproteobacteria bacterium]|nr:nuclear transport factor 2 family protein [Alphaproteobacteria bacterium]